MINYDLKKIKAIVFDVDAFPPDHYACQYG